MKRMHIIVAMMGEPNPVGVVFPEATLIEIRHQLAGRPVVSARNGRILTTVSEAYLKKIADEDSVLPMRQALYAAIDVPDEHQDQVEKFLADPNNYVTPIWDAPITLKDHEELDYPAKVVQNRIVVRGVLLCPG